MSLSGLKEPAGVALITSEMNYRLQGLSHGNEKIIH